MKKYLIFFIFILILFHQNISNSAIGNNNALLGVFFFMLIWGVIFLSTLAFELYHKKSFYIMLFLFLLSVPLWVLDGGKYRDLSFLLLNFYLAYFLYATRSLGIVKNQLYWCLVICLPLIFLQITGLFSFLHDWNSLFLRNNIAHFYKEIKINNILLTDYSDYFYYDSNQVRSPGIFHSSAVISTIMVIYFANLFNGNYSFRFRYYLAPMLIVFSGAKLTMFAFLIMLIIAITYRKLNGIHVRQIVISFILVIIIHTFLFKGLFYEQFNLRIIQYSFDVRIKNYDLDIIWDFIDFKKIALTILLLSSIVIGTAYFFNWFKDRYKSLIFAVALFSAYFAIPQIGNLFYGWFLFSTVLYVDSSLDLNDE